MQPARQGSLLHDFWASMGGLDAEVGERSRCSMSTCISRAAIPSLSLSLIYISHLQASPRKAPVPPPAGGAKRVPIPSKLQRRTKWGSLTPSGPSSTGELTFR